MKSFWFNLPVKDLKKSKEFFRAIGFKENPDCVNATDMGSFLMGEKEVPMMLFPEDALKKFTQGKIADPKLGAEVLLNIDAQSKEEVDAMAETVSKAGGKIFSKPGVTDGWYAFGFEDLDGHKWNMLCMKR